MSQKDKFVRLFGPTSVAVVVLLFLIIIGNMQSFQYYFFGIVFFAWDAYDKKKKEKEVKK